MGALSLVARIGFVAALCIGCGNGPSTGPAAPTTAPSAGPASPSAVTSTSPTPSPSVSASASASSASTVPSAAPAPASGSPARLAEGPALALSLPGVTGIMVSALEWTDAEGRGVAVATEERDANANRVLLHVYAFKLPASGAPVSLWEMNDGVATCAFDNTTAFMKPALETSDVDHDGIVEVVIAYRAECAKGPSPQTHQVRLYEGGTQYALRGTILRAPAPRLPGYTKVGKAQYALKADASFEAAPNELREAMRARWDAIVRGAGAPK